MNRQAAKDFEKADAQLNSTYGALMAKLPDAESKRKLKESQRAWIAFRDAEAAFAADQARGGSMAPTVRYETMTELTQQRIKQLKTTVGDAAAGEDAETAKPPGSSNSDIDGQGSATGEKIRNISPNKKFAMQILYDAETEQADSKKIDSTTIKAIELVALPAKNKILDLLPSNDVREL